MGVSSLNICILAAGAAGMYCGSCLRDNQLAIALRRLGHNVTLVPLYAPLRVDSTDASIHQVFYGGVNAYLQFASGLFRHTPRMIDWLLDRPWLLRMAGRYGAQTSPAKLGPFVLSILRGEEGPQVKELRRLARFLHDDVRPDVITLPNAMFVGIARLLREELKAPVVCELTGEDIFLDAMAEPYRSQAQQIIRQRAAEVDRFVATSNYYAARMAEYLAVPRSRIDVVYPGIALSYLSDGGAGGAQKRPPTVGYFARICPEKGLDRLVEAFALLRRMPQMGEARLRAAGYLGPLHRRWFESLQDRMRAEGIADAVSYEGEVDLGGKLAFLDSIDVLSVPAAYAEPKGIYVLEGLARAVPFVKPDHGAFPELARLTGGGVLYPAGDAQALAERLHELLLDPARRAELGGRGQQAVRERFTDEHMAMNMLKVFEAART